MKAGFLLPALLLSLLSASPSVAGTAVSIRLVEATNREPPASQGVDDVAAVLKRSGGYNSFRVVGSTSVALPAVNQSRALGGYSVACNGKQGNLQIKVSHGKQSLLNTTVDLADNRPFILAGLPIKDGKMILVFVVR